MKRVPRVAYPTRFRTLTHILGTYVRTYVRTIRAHTCERAGARLHYPFNMWLGTDANAARGMKRENGSVALFL